MTTPVGYTNFQRQVLNAVPGDFNKMKRNQLLKHLKKHGASLLREGR